MRATRRGLFAALAVCAAVGPSLGGEATRAGAVSLPAGLFTPFQRVKPVGAGESATPAAAPIAAFSLDVEPVTNGQFLAFVTAHPEWRKSSVKPVFADARYLARWRGDLDLPEGPSAGEPATNVSWFAARAYCRSLGRRLPSTEQWEYALADAGRGQDEARQVSLRWFEKPNGARPGAVGAGRANGYGLRDLVGLVWEWTLDFDAFAVSAESRDPNGKDSAQFCGGAAAGVSDPSDYPAFMRYAMRASLKANYTADNLGFRCAGDP